MQLWVKKLEELKKKQENNTFKLHDLIWAGPQDAKNIFLCPLSQEQQYTVTVQQLCRPGQKYSQNCKTFL